MMDKLSNTKYEYNLSVYGLVKHTYMQTYSDESA
jgi:hypothetical protein